MPKKLPYGAPCAEDVRPSEAPFVPKGEPKDVSLHRGNAGGGGSRGMLSAFGKTLEATRHDQSTQSRIEASQTMKASATLPNPVNKQRPG